MHVDLEGRRGSQGVNREEEDGTVEDVAARVQEDREPQEDEEARAGAVISMRRLI